MTTDKWTDRLSEYLDGELNEAERRALETHLESCRECAATLEDLQGVVARAGSLDDRPPVRDLWSGIADRIGSSSGVTSVTEVQAIGSAPSRTRRLLKLKFTLGVPQLAAAAVALIVISGSVVGGFAARRSPPAAAGSGTNPGRQPGVEVMATASAFGGARFDSAVVELEQALAANRGHLDSATVRIIRQNLALIDQAIDQARRALLADPGSLYLSDHLAGTLKRKVELLRRVTALTATES
jgi:hypothetical protein